MLINKMSVTSLAASALLFVAMPAISKTVKLKLGHVAPATSTYQDAAKRFAANLAKLSSDTMAVSIVPGGALGDLGQHWVQTKTGSIDLHLVDIAAMVAMKPARQMIVMWTPFLFTDQTHFRRFVAGDLFSQMMAETSKASGVVYLGYAGDRPPRALTTAKTPVRRAADLKGLKIRTPSHPMIIGAFKAWGANPTPIKASELFTALKTGLVDGQDNGVLDFIGAGYHTAQKQYMPLDYIHSGVGIWMSPSKWSAMSEQQKQWLKQAAFDSGAQGKALHDKAMASSLAALAKLGVEVVEPDIASFQFATKTLVDKMEGKLWPDGLFKKIQAQ